LKEKKNILICPLEWGLGHAARMIPVAEKLRDLNFNIIFGAGEKHLAFLRGELPNLTYINFPGFRPVYSRFLPQYIVLLLEIPVLIYHIISEHFRLKKIITQHAIDIVISDNRFGLWNKKIKSVYITHQPLIPFPRFLSFLEFTGVYLHRQIIRKFTFCFIPDLPGELNFTGRLSHGVTLPQNARFTGILSRFYGLPASNDSPSPKPGNITVILSGPEPQRAILEKKLTGILKNKNQSVSILGGRPDRQTGIIRTGNITRYDHLQSQAMKDLISESGTIISRAGYTTIMELLSLGRSALLIPTPGQTEQEYLSSYLAMKGWFSAISQKKLNESLLFLPEKTEWNNEIMAQSRILLDKALKELSEKPEAEA
jgi:spore coat polysaccharide biosynthesis predicted glycosyltransferase SpsG